MEEIIQNYLNRYISLTPEITESELQFLRENLTITKLNKKDFFLKAGEIQRNLGFLSSGLLRAFYIDKNDNEITMAFIQENEYVTHYESFSEQKSSKYSFQCLEPCFIINLPYDKMIEGITNYKNLEQYARVFKETIAIQQQNRIESLLHENAEERYSGFIKDNAKLFNRISLTHLSSYLGLGRQSISRIRKTIVTK
jgi:CRP/FNR family transcriptional regulator, anaerobic regulatory protein